MDSSINQRSGLKNWWVALLFGIGYFLFLCPVNVPAKYSFSSDNRYYIASSQRLIREGTWNLQGYGDTQFLPGDYRLKPGKEGRILNLYPPGVSLMALPIVVIGNRILPETKNGKKNDAIISAMAAKLFSALTIAFFYLIAEILSRRRGWAILLTFIYAFATPQLATHGGALWSHNVTSLLSMVGLFHFLWHDGKWSAYSAIPFAFGFWCRPTMIVVTVIFGLYLLFKDRKKGVLYFALAMVTTSGFVALSLHLWGEPLPPYYSSHAGAQQNSLTGLWGTIFSPNRGLLIYSPLFILSLLGAIKAKHSIYHLATLVFCIGWIIAARNPMWWGGYSYGPRLFGEIFPWLMILLIPACEFLMNAGYRSFLILFLIICCGWGTFVQMQGAFRPSVHKWSAVMDIDRHPERLWNWQNWQIFANGK